MERVWLFILFKVIVVVILVKCESNNNLLRTFQCQLVVLAQPELLLELIKHRI